MAQGATKRSAPRGLARLFFRLPIWLYRLRLGWLFGDRLLLLTHIGRTSGKPRQAVIEVIRHDRASDTFVIASGLGEQVDWFRNIKRHPNGPRRACDRPALAQGHSQRIPAFATELEQP